MIKLKDDEYWHYSESNYSLSKTGDRLDVAWIGRDMSKTKFIRTIAQDQYRNDFSKWIYDRCGAGGNKEHLKIAKENEGNVIAVEDRTDKILKILEVI